VNGGLNKWGKKKNEKRKQEKKYTSAKQKVNEGREKKK
jgi:hypothetical protein